MKNIELTARVILYIVISYGVITYTNSQYAKKAQPTQAEWESSFIEKWNAGIDSLSDREVQSLMKKKENPKSILDKLEFEEKQK
jgi:hypothetical protein